MRSIVISLALLANGCVVAAGVIGNQCDLSSDCDSMLRCELGRCREQCLGTRDCALGQRCVLVRPDLGVCLLADEVECDLPSDCDELLTCSMGVCTNECAGDVDCVRGARCVAGSCEELAVEGCVYHSDCAYPLVCDDERCVAECRADVDCEEPGRECFSHAECFGGPCMCRFPCAAADACPNPGTVCAPEGYCEREALVAP